MFGRNRAFYRMLGASLRELNLSKEKGLSCSVPVPEWGRYLESLRLSIEQDEAFYRTYWSLIYPPPPTFTVRVGQVWQRMIRWMLPLLRVAAKIPKYIKGVGQFLFLVVFYLFVGGWLSLSVGGLFHVADSGMVAIAWFVMIPVTSIALVVIRLVLMHRKISIELQKSIETQLVQKYVIHKIRLSQMVFLQTMVFQLQPEIDPKQNATFAIQWPEFNQMQACWSTLGIELRLLDGNHMVTNWKAWFSVFEQDYWKIETEIEAAVHCENKRKMTLTNAKKRRIDRVRINGISIEPFNQQGKAWKKVIVKGCSAVKWKPDIHKPKTFLKMVRWLEHQPNAHDLVHLMIWLYQKKITFGQPNNLLAKSTTPLQNSVR
jgi:hypothetical protein